MRRLNRKHSPAVGGSKYIKSVVSGKLKGTWDMANRYFLVEVPGGIDDAYIKFKGIDGIHLLRFNAFECAGYQVDWDEADYPIDCEDYIIEREFRQLKRFHPHPVELTFPCVHGFRDFYCPAFLACLVGGRVPLGLCRFSLCERRAQLSLYRACDKARGPHMVSDRCINRWSISPTHGNPPPVVPSPKCHSPSLLPAHHSKSTSTHVGFPPPSPFPLVIVYCGKPGHSACQCHDYNRPCSPNFSKVHPPATAVADSLSIPYRTLTLSNPPLPTINKQFLLLLLWALRSLFTA